MTNYKKAIEDFNSGDIVTAMKEISNIYCKETHCNELIEFLLSKLIDEEKSNREEIFNENSKLLEVYPYIFNKNFTKQSTFTLLPISEEISYIYDSINFKFEHIEINSKQETKYFFENLDNAVYVENEFNEFNLNFLVDNVRASEDVAYENHIYLYYDCIEYFSMLLYYCDFTPLLEKQKIVFLIGEEEKSMYPIDFKERFNIDYYAMEFQEVRIDEIKRLVLQNHISVNSGNNFFSELFDGANSLLNMSSIQQFLNTTFGYFNANISLNEYIDIVKNTISNSEINSLSRIMDGFILTEISPFNVESEFIKFFKIFENICIKNKATTKKDWLCANYLAFETYSNFENYQRISPTIHHILHHAHIKNRVYHSDKIYKYLKPIIEEFPYFYSYSHIRDPIVSIRGHLKIKKVKQFNINMFNFDMITWWFRYLNYLSDDLDFRYSHEFDKKIFIRFEDMKLNPKATLVATCKWLNIPYDDSMEICTFMGKPIYIEEPAENEVIGEVKSGFSVHPMYPRDMYDKVFSKENIEILEKFLYPTYQYMGYKPLYLDEEQVNSNLTDYDFEVMKKNKFLFEKQFMKISI